MSRRMAILGFRALQGTWFARNVRGVGVAGTWDIGEKAPIKGGFWEKEGRWQSRRRRNASLGERLILMDSDRESMFR